MDPLADLELLEEWLGVTPDSIKDDVIASAKGDLFLRTASSVVRNHTGVTWWDADTETPLAVPEDVELVTLRLAARVWNNPQAVKQSTTGPLSITFTEEAAKPLTLTDVELGLLEGFVVKSSTSGVAGLWTLSTTRGDIETGVVYTHAAGSTYSFPWLAPEDA